MADDDLRHEAISGANGKTSTCNPQANALVLYNGGVFLKPASIQWLGPHIDLRIPPQNWMRARSPVEKYVERTLTMGRQRSHMSSISMAMANIDQVDSADVISDAKNIRSLLASAFATDQPVSLMVHRVGKTLLIDEFDIHKHLLRQQKSDWKWLRSFYEQQIKQYPRASRNQRQLVERNLFSKFLYYSIMSHCEAESHEEEKGIVSNIEGPEPQSRPAESQATQDEEIGSDEFFRTLQWNFEDIKMMIGTDIPIFSAGSSLVSLRLRDANSTINVLTGLGYWLDNLMCNVPEIAMCYHQSGFVQRYERMPTSEIPSLKGAEFEPAYVKDLAQHILSFLKANATKFGHTYWLYKEKKGDIIKLYDLTSLCETEEEARQDPFRLPLATLLFKMAIKLHKKKSSSKSSLIRALLTSCLTLLHHEHPEMTVSAAMILSEIFLKEDPSSDNGADAADNDSDNESCMSDTSSLPNEPPNGDADSTKACGELNLTSLPQNASDSAAVDSPPFFPALPDDEEARYEMALAHIAQALVALDDDIEAQQATDEAREPERANSSKPIPLPYAPLITKQTLVEEENGEEEVEVKPASVDVSPSVELIQQNLNRFPANSWHRLSKAKLLSKAMYALYKLADAYNLFTMEYGQALKYTKLVLLCFEALFNIEPGMARSRWALCSFILELAAGTHLKLAKKDDVTQYRENFERLTNDEAAIMKSALKEIATKQYEHLSAVYKQTENRLLAASQCYDLSRKFAELLQGEQVSLAVGEQRVLDLLKVLNQRQGNCCNELARFYIDKAARIYKSADSVDKELRSRLYRLLSASEPYLEKGMACFESVSDRTNMALIIANSGNILRLKAALLVNKIERGEVSAEERGLYTQAADKYLQALNMLPRTLPSSSLYIKDRLRSELSEVYYTLATLLQDFTPHSSYSRQQIERDITNFMMKALKYGDANSEDTAKRHRGAAIHHRLGSLFHNSYRADSEISEQRKRQHRQMTEAHYTKALELYRSLDCHIIFLRLLLEKVALYEFDFKAVTGKCGKIRHLESGLSILLGSEVQYCIKSFCSEEGSAIAGQEAEIKKLLTIFTSRLQFFLLNMLKLTKISPASHSGAFSRSSSADSQNARYKRMYKESLNLKSSYQVNSTVLSTDLLPILCKLQELHAHST